MFSLYKVKMLILFSRYENTTRSSILPFMPEARSSWKDVPVTSMSWKKLMLNGLIFPNRKTL